MLNIFYGDMKDAIYNTSAYFKFNFDKEWMSSPEVIQMIHLLILKSSGTYLKYSKDHLNKAYLQDRIVEKVVSCLPDAIKSMLENV